MFRRLKKSQFQDASATLYPEIFSVKVAAKRLKALNVAAVLVAAAVNVVGPLERHH